MLLNLHCTCGRAQLIDVANDMHFFSEVLDRPVHDVFAVQDEVSLLIADKLREHFGHFDISQSLVARPDIPVNAYIDYMRGGTPLAHIMLGHQETASAGMEQLQAALDTNLTERTLNFFLICQAQLGHSSAILKTFEKSISLRLPMLMYFFVDPLMKPMR